MGNDVVSHKGVGCACFDCNSGCLFDGCWSWCRKKCLEESIGTVLSSISLSVATIAVFFISVCLFLKGGVSFGRAVLIRNIQHGYRKFT